jgi:hypothetical protein
MMHAYLSLPRFWTRPRSADPTPAETLGRMIERWNQASDLDDEQFRDQYLDWGVSLDTVGAVRMAAAGAATAQTSGEMADAGVHLAKAIETVGVADWPDFLKVAERRTDEIAHPDRVDAYLRTGVKDVAPDGTPFLVPDHADFAAIRKYGEIISHLPFLEREEAIRLAVNQGGFYDFQRKGGRFYNDYTDASNYAVGVLMYSAGYSWLETKTIAGAYATVKSKPKGWTARQTDWWWRGFKAAEDDKLPPAPLPSGARRVE